MNDGYRGAECVEEKREEERAVLLEGPQEKQHLWLLHDKLWEGFLSDCFLSKAFPKCIKIRERDRESLQ